MHLFTSRNTQIQRLLVPEPAVFSISIRCSSAKIKFHADTQMFATLMGQETFLFEISMLSHKPPQPKRGDCVTEKVTKLSFESLATLQNKNDTNCLQAQEMFIVQREIMLSKALQKSKPPLFLSTNTEKFLDVRAHQIPHCVYDT